MTRFMITLEQGVQLVWHALEDMVGGEIYVRKIPSMRVTDIAEAVDPAAKHEIVGVRPGEKLHEEMVSREDIKKFLLIVRPKNNSTDLLLKRS
jgi:FlaA1/EpsC-like NDP-sugar epimerase